MGIKDSKRQKVCLWGIIICCYTVFLFSPATAQNNALAADLWKDRELYRAPAVQWLNTQAGIRSLLYTGVPYRGAETEVFAFYSNPDLIAGRNSSGNKYPAVVLIHGSGGTAFREWVEKWARAGYAAIAMDLTGKDPSGKRLTRGGAIQSEETMFTDITEGNLKNMWTYQCVANIMLSHSLLLSFPEVDARRTAVTGISRGGYMTCVVAGVDHRFKAAVPVYGCGFIEETGLKNGLNRLDGIWKTHWINQFDPSIYLSKVRMPMLFVNGNKDQFYTVLPYAKSYELLPPKYRYICIKPDMGHSHVAGWEPTEVKHFIDAVLHRKKKMLSVVKLDVSRPDEIRAKISGQASVRYAAFYHSDDTKSENSQRKWKQDTVQFNPKTGRILLTNDIKYNYGFLFFTTKEGISFSSNFIIPDHQF
jgi:dienelactone hydrolase